MKEASKSDSLLGRQLYFYSRRYLHTGIEKKASRLLESSMPGLRVVVLHSKIFLILCQRWGKTDVDIMVSRFNKKLIRLVARSRDPLTFVVDGLVIPWSPFTLVYELPPLELLSQNDKTNPQDRGRTDSSNPLN